MSCKLFFAPYVVLFLGPLQRPRGAPQLGRKTDQSICLEPYLFERKGNGIRLRRVGNKKPGEQRKPVLRQKLYLLQHKKTMKQEELISNT